MFRISSTWNTRGVPKTKGVKDSGKNRNAYYEYV